MHVAVAVDPFNAHVPVNTPEVALLVKVTVPVGVRNVPGEVSWTFAVHVVVWLIATVDGEHNTLAVVLRFWTVMFAVPWLVACVESPLYVPVIV